MEVGSRFQIKVPRGSVSMSDDITIDRENWDKIVFEVTNISPLDDITLKAYSTVYDIEAEAVVDGIFLDEIVNLGCELIEREQKISKKDPLECTCDSWTILHFGCKCGAFRAEQGIKTQEDVDELINRLK